MKVSIKQYAQTLFELTDGKSEQDVLAVVKNFAEKLKADGQIKNLKNILEKFSQLYNQKHGIVEAEVVTKSDMRKETRDMVEKLVKERYSAKEVVINNVVDDKSKGGIVIRVGDEVIDGSVEMQLKKLQKELSK